MQALRGIVLVGVLMLLAYASPAWASQDLPYCILRSEALVKSIRVYGNGTYLLILNTNITNIKVLRDNSLNINDLMIIIENNNTILISNKDNPLAVIDKGHTHWIYSGKIPLVVIGMGCGEITGTNTSTYSENTTNVTSTDMGGTEKSTTAFKGNIGSNHANLEPRELEGVKKGGFNLQLVDIQLAVSAGLAVLVAVKEYGKRS